MKKIMISALMLVLTAGLFSTEASARGFGGFKRFNYARTSSYKASPARSSTMHQSGSRMKGFLGGLLLGGIITSLFMGHGLASGLLSWLILIGVVGLIITMLRNRRPPNSFR